MASSLYIDIHWNATIINPEELIQISRGDNSIVYKYLLQFHELIPARIDSLEESLKVGDRKRTIQLLHQMSPQLQFFGIKDIVQPIRRLELKYETMPFEDLSSLVDDILINLHLALKDVILHESTDGTNYNLIP
jgi:HPt (histidine-containing phosphotransfer) domain-containing protein